MKKGKLEMFRLRLLAEKTRVLGQLDRIERNMEEAAGDYFEFIAQRERQRNLQQTLAEINNALGRIENGTFGRSEVSGKPIPIRRLEALPWARQRVDEAIEKVESAASIIRPFARSFLAE